MHRRRLGWVMIASAAFACADMDEGEVGSETAAHTTSTPGAAVWVDYGARFEHAIGDGGSGAYVSGRFSRTLRLDGFSYDAVLQGNDFPHGFLARVDAFGDYQWVVPFEGSNGVSLGVQAIDASGNLIVRALVPSGSIDFGCGPLASHGPGRSVLLKMTAGAECLWQIDFKNREEFLRTHISADTDGDAVIVAGHWAGVMTIDGRTFVTHDFPEEDSQEIFVARLLADGSLDWIQIFGEAPGEGGPVDNNHRDYSLLDVGVDANGNIVFTGSFARPLDLGDGPMVPAEGDSYVAKLRRSGNFVYARHLTGAEPTDIAVADGGPYTIAGIFTATADFGSETVTTRGVGGPDIFVVKFDHAGDDQWARHLHGSASIMSISGLALDHHGNIAVGVNFLGGSLNLGDLRWVAGPDTSGMIAVFRPVSGSTRWARAIGDEDSGAFIGTPGFTSNSRVVLGGSLVGTVDAGDGPSPEGASGFLARYFP